jgi:hypothetical protein
VPELIPPSATVHWLGAGLSTGSGLRLVCAHADRVVLWNRTLSRARELLDKLGLSGQAQARSYDLAVLAEVLEPGDVVVSMLPATEHAAVVQLCLNRRAHFACSSYTSPELAQFAPRLVTAGLVALTEAGLDPGIDHLLAHHLVAQGLAAFPDQAVTATFLSYCGGVPAEANDFRYRFSWAPQGVLSALCSPARYLEGGVEHVATYPWEATREHVLRAETFEVYPNRDSLPFIEQYGFPQQWQLDTFIRGTLRLAGWRAAWKPVFEQLRTGDLDERNALADALAAKYPTGAADRDRVVLAVSLHLRTATGATWEGEHVLDLLGDAHESAMARCVSVPVAFGVAQILAGNLAPGLHRAARNADEAQRWLEFLATQGIISGVQA